MEIGNQYNLDDEFKAAARLHQSKYRAEVLQVEFEDYGNRLNDKDAQVLLNYYDKLNSRQILRRRYPSYSKKRDTDMLRSEHIPFNLLAPLDSDRQMAINIIKDAFEIDCVAIDFIGIEYAPEPKGKYLKDKTSFDAYIVVVSNGKKCGIGIEVKYTEHEYRIGKSEAVNVKNHDSLYWKTARASDCFINPDDEIFGTDTLRQIWRNHLLGLAIVERGDIDEFYSITLFPDGNNHFHKVLPIYISLLKDNSQQYVFGCTFEKFISVIGGTSNFEEWKEWLERRYIVKP
ncbi:MAG: hypothetical protein K9M57_08980 [Phycisphaerae bacterium]|nr:hypothetical protein [Phycisphaerae bacterium]